MVKIIADSTCDLSPELVERYDISILPLSIALGETVYEDGKTLTPQEIFRWAESSKAVPKTAAPSVASAMAVLEPCVRDGGEAVCFAISETMSASATAMRLAAEELSAQDRVTVIDSANLSTGIGLLVIEAAMLAREGRTVAEITEHIDALKPKVRASFVVDTLTYLHRGGRCGGLEAMLGGALRLHPKIMVENGAMHAEKKYRGHMDKVYLAYVKDLTPALMAARPERVFITHSSQDAAAVRQVRDYLAGLGHFAEILETHAGGVVSSHCGPGTLGVLFIAQ